MLKRVVIIGAGIAGVQAASSLSGSSSITLINNEDFLPYYRMRIEEVISGASPESLYMHPASWYEEKGIELASGTVKRIDTSSMNVLLEDGREFPFDDLVIATGSEANVFPLEGGRTSVHALRRMADALALKETIENGAGSIAVIGGGLLGLELAASVAAHRPKMRVSVIEVSEWILPRQLDRDSAHMLAGLLEEKGVHIITGRKAVKADDSSLYLDDGQSVSADILCFSSGVHASIAALEGSGIKTDRGIVVDDHLRTSAAHVYAAGDAAELDGRSFGLAVHAREMGSFVASVINGADKPYLPSQPSAILKVGGLDVASFGSMDGEAHVAEDGNSRRTVFVKDGIVSGAVLIGGKAEMARMKASIGKPYEG